MENRGVLRMRAMCEAGAQHRTRISGAAPVQVLTWCKEPLEFCYSWDEWLWFTWEERRHLPHKVAPLMCHGSFDWNSADRTTTNPISQSCKIKLSSKLPIWDAMQTIVLHVRKQQKGSIWYDMANSQKESGGVELPEAAYHLDLDRSERWHHKRIISYILG